MHFTPRKGSLPVASTSRVLEQSLPAILGDCKLNQSMINKRSDSQTCFVIKHAPIFKYPSPNKFGFPLFEIHFRSPESNCRVPHISILRCGSGHTKARSPTAQALPIRAPTNHASIPNAIPLTGFPCGFSGWKMFAASSPAAPCSSAHSATAASAARASPAIFVTSSSTNAHNATCAAASSSAGLHTVIIAS